MEIIGVRSTSAAAIELGKTLLTLVLCIDITAFELVTDIISYHTGIHIAHEELLVTHELMAGIQVSPGSNRQIFGTGSTAGESLGYAGTALQIDHKVEEIESLALFLTLDHFYCQFIVFFL